MTVLIVGLGNPGTKYGGTRHNMGQLVIEELCQRAVPMPIHLKVHKRTNTEIAETSLAQQRVVLARTRGFMNVSGGPVKALAGYFDVPAQKIIAIYDDMEIDFGAIKSRLGGRDHGHNGLRSLSTSLGTKDYYRLGVGIGRPPGRMDPAAFVLKEFTRTEREELPIICADAADQVERLVTQMP